MDFDPRKALYGDIAHVFAYKNPRRLSCQVCRVDLFPELLSLHIMDPGHAERLNRLTKFKEAEELLSARRERVSTIVPYLSELGLAVWRDDVRMQLYSYAMDSSVPINGARAAFDKYDRMERISLLELAVWKFMCKMTPPATLGTTILDCHLWLTSGWKEKKADMRSSKSIAFIVSRVVEYAAFESRPVPSNNSW